MINKLRVGIIGCGKITQVRHLPEYLEREEVEVVGLCDENLERASALASTYNIPFVTNQADDIIYHPDIQAVSVCTPNKFHAEQSIKALKQNKHVLVEKPVATSIQELNEMYGAALENDKLLIVGHNQRFDPVHLKAKKMITEGSIGNILQFTSNYQHPGPKYWSLDGDHSWFFNQQLSSFGVVGDLGIHKVDLMQWILEDVFSEWKVFKNAVLDDRAVISLKTQSGVVGSINVSWNNPLQDHRTVIYGDKGIMTFGEEFHILKVEKFDGEIIEVKIEPILRRDGKPSSCVIDHFLDCILYGISQVVNPRHVINSLEIITS
ncbi:Gfo/Idh/MocA family oxidoreductase [Fictibacillus sp. KIGAM418]|uniref:Gfo/Idh/MocA family oxidoreductase n=1 Tax=Fictibacillus marinisediminis TaxID=2878389 RepID=A0A9X1XEQ2_9BACL|nr:Gfo/Idh/MocA family oxidoreductase [Fictibacillus marinisediminis]MCK6259444.1 Gfo/Idh/MocA family oxidoreductase [Fictibacillus marinisediminis]